MAAPTSCPPCGFSGLPYQASRQRAFPYFTLLPPTSYDGNPATYILGSLSISGSMFIAEEQMLPLPSTTLQLENASRWVALLLLISTL
jgi:hypothetical protein